MRRRDFTGFPAGNIALIQRGICNFAVKALNAEAAGASAVIIFNQGNAGPRSDLIVGTLGGNDIVDIPVVGASFSRAVSLLPGRTRPRGSWSPQPEQRPQRNVIAELPGHNDDNVVMAGAHLDSVQAGPGINDNGSGSSALLEIAQQLAKLKPENTVRFAWWGAEESGLIGSTQYVAGLSQAEKDRIALYLNFDMVASPNYIFMVYDGNESGWDAPAGVPIPEGSVADRGPLREPLHQDGRALRRRAVQRSQRLPGLHQQRDPVGWPLHRRRGRQDRGAGGHLGR